jgi:hypothetical protein
LHTVGKRVGLALSVASARARAPGAARTAAPALLIGDPLGSVMPPVRSVSVGRRAIPTPIVRAPRPRRAARPACRSRRRDRDRPAR